MDRHFQCSDVAPFVAQQLSVFTVSAFSRWSNDTRSREKAAWDTRERRITRKLLHTFRPPRAFTSFFARCRLDHGHGQKKDCAISFPSLDHDLLTLERSRGNDKRSEEGIVLGEYKFGKLDRSSFAGKLAFEANVLVLRNEYLDFRYVGYFWTNKIIEKKFFRVWNIWTKERSVSVQW